MCSGKIDPYPQESYMGKHTNEGKGGWSSTICHGYVTVYNSVTLRTAMSTKTINIGHTQN